jgi:sn-glycerol 3-phosphate transport system permease protein
MGRKKVFNGLGNFVDLFTSPKFHAVVGKSFIFSFSVVVGGLVIGLAIALLANRKVRGARLYRTGLIWPYALSPAIAGTIWLFLFNPNTGMLTYVIEVLFGVQPDWLASGPLSMFMVIVAATWKNLGYNIIFFLAGLQNVPGEFLEAADVDGANVFQKFWHITLPLLSPTIFFLVVMNMIYSFFRTFALIDIMTKGGPAGATNIMIFNLYRDAFQYFRSGIAASQSLLLFVLVSILTLIQFKTSGKGVYYGG